MFKWLFVLPLIAFIDPFLLYRLWPHLNMWSQALLLIAYPLAATVYTRTKPLQEGDVLTRGARLAARVAAWYPGPISKLISLFLIVPPMERLLVRWAAKLFQQHILRGIQNVNQTRPHGPAKNDGLLGDDRLKRVRGRVVE